MKIRFKAANALNGHESYESVAASIHEMGQPLGVDHQIPHQNSPSLGLRYHIVGNAMVFAGICWLKLYMLYIVFLKKYPMISYYLPINWLVLYPTIFGF